MFYTLQGLLLSALFSTPFVPWHTWCMDQHANRLSPAQLKYYFQVGYKDCWGFFPMCFFIFSPAGTQKMQYFLTGTCYVHAGPVMVKGQSGNWRISLSSTGIPSAMCWRMLHPQGCLLHLSCAVQMTEHGQRKEPLGNGFSWWTNGNVTSRRDKHT